MPVGLGACMCACEFLKSAASGAQHYTRQTVFVLRPWRYLRSDRNTFCDCDVRRTGVFALLVQYLYPATVHLANAPTHFKDIIRVYDFAFLFLEAPIIKLVQVQKFEREHYKLQVKTRDWRP